MKRRLAVLWLLGLTLILALVPAGFVSAADLTSRTLLLSDYTLAAANTQYNFSFTTATAGPVGSISLQICDDYQFNAGDPCVSPVGFDASAATLTSQTGITDFSIDPASTSHVLILTRPVATVVPPTPLTMQFSGITNPTNIGSYYVRIETHAASDASDPETDFGTIVFAMSRAIDINTEVPPYLQFCSGVTIDNFDCNSAQGNFIDFGELSSTLPRTATSQLLASTNADNGYSITMAGTTMTAGTNVIPALSSGAASQTGTSQFGVNSRANSGPTVGADPFGPGIAVPDAGYNTPNQFRFNSGDFIVSADDGDDYRKFTISYLVNIAANQPPGKYVATLSYICLANF